MTLFLVLSLAAAAAFALALIRPLLSASRREPGARTPRMAAVGFTLLAPLVVAGTYMRIGAPELLSASQRGAPEQVPVQGQAPDAGAIAAMDPEAQAQAIDAMVAGLAARLEEEPGNIDGWRRLARAQAVLNRPMDSARSLERVFALTAGDVEDWRNYAANFIAAAPEGVFPTDARFARALEEIETRAPGDILSRFYRGGVARESGDFDEAGTVWRALRADLPDDDRLAGVLDQLIAELPALAARAEASSGPPSGADPE